MTEAHAYVAPQIEAAGDREWLQVLKEMAGPTTDVETAGKFLGIGRNAAYKARAAGDIPSIKVGGQWRVPTAPLKRMVGFGMEANAA